ncbi:MULTISPECIES: NUDIX hydrolase [unclassified Myroides]|uniref:NUDIX hydrolase n=1 Tax=unclassified Myroides TaxID=2642485 RepID=UPI003D2F805E
MDKVHQTTIDLLPLKQADHLQLLELKKQGILYCVASDESVADRTDWGQRIGYFTQVNDVVVGYFILCPKGGFGELEELCLLPAYANHGIVQGVIAKSKAVGLAHDYSYLLTWTTTAFKLFFEQLGGQLSQVVPATANGQERLAYYLPVVDEPWIDLPTAGLVCLKGDRLLLAYSKNKKAWYLPGGKIDQGENSQEALIREIEEELSLVLQPDRLSFLTRIVAPAYGEKKNRMMQQDCYVYELMQDKIAIANEIGGVQYFSLAEYTQGQIPVPGVLKVFDFLSTWKK